MPKTHKAQHYVPKSYLKAWCDPVTPIGYEPYVWLFSKDGAIAKQRAPSNIFTETDIYTIEKADGTRDLRLEHGLAGIETQFTKIRRLKLDKKKMLTHEEIAYLALFVAAAQFRTRSSRDHHAAQWGNVVALGDEILEKMKTATPEQKRAAASVNIPSDKRSTFTHDQARQLAQKPLQTMMPTILREVTTILAKMNMVIFWTDDPVGFITSDCPVMWFDPEAYRRPPFYRAPALASETIQVTMPISPSQCLAFAWNAPSGHNYMKATPFALNELNRLHRLNCAENYIVNSNTKNDYWFKEIEPPEDAWEKRNP